MNAPVHESRTGDPDTSPRGRVSRREETATPADPHGALESLLALATSRPDDATRAAHRILSADPTPRETSVAHHVLAIVERDRGRIDAALSHARRALRAGPAAGPGREAEVRATIGTTYLFAGETTKALRELDRAMQVASGGADARVLHLRGATYWLLGRYDDALRDLGRAVELSRQAGDALWQGRSLGTTGDVLRAMGRDRASERAYRDAEAILAAVGRGIEVANAVHNRALGSAQRGDVVDALSIMERAREGYRAVGVEPIEQLVNYALTLVSARLASEARLVLDVALQRPDVAPIWRADLLLASARVALLEGAWAAASTRATQAGDLFRAHRRVTWAARARLLALEAGYAPHRDPGVAAPVPGSDEAAATPALRPLEDLYVASGRLVRRLQAIGDTSVSEAQLLYAQIAYDAGHERAGRRTLAVASRARLAGPPLARAAGWLAGALLADAQGDRRALAHACRRGLDAVDEHRRVIGDLELRALAGGYGQELLTLAARDAAARGDGRGLLQWVERWRSIALMAPPTRPDDPALARDTASLRDVSRRLMGADEDPFLRRERARLEAAVRTRYRHLRATGEEQTGADLPALLSRLGSTVLLYVVLVDGMLHAVTVAGGRASLRHLGDHSTAMQQADLARFTLRRAAHGRRVDVEAAGLALQRALLGDDLPRSWSSPSVLVVPAASLLTVPWGLLPVFARSEVTVSPSLTLWHRAQGEPSGRTARSGHVTLVTGPDLSTRQSEIVQLRRVHAEATVVHGEGATVEATLAALDGARLGHIAAHGTFRADAPLFSSLLLADGPLMIHDLDRLSSPPDAVVLSACDSGGLRAIGADEALGLVSSLLAMGTRGVVASVNAVNDVATMTVMDALHSVVAAGGSLPAGLLAARRTAQGDPLVAATAASFNAWGA